MKNLPYIDDWESIVELCETAYRIAKSNIQFETDKIELTSFQMFEFYVYLWENIEAKGSYLDDLQNIINNELIYIYFNEWVEQYK